MAVPETLATLRALVRERLFLSAFDPMFPDTKVNRYINIAISDVTSMQPDGWWWQHVEQDVQNGASAVAAFGVHLSTPDNARLIRKVRNVFCSLDGAYWLPIPERGRTDAVRLAGGQRVANGDLPLAWTAQAVAQTISGVKSNIALIFDPPLPASMWVRFIAVVMPKDLAADGDTLVGVPPILTDLVVEKAVVRCLVQRRAVGSLTSRRRYATELSIAQSAVKEWEQAARLYFASPAAGPAYTTLQGNL